MRLIFVDKKILSTAPESYKINSCVLYDLVGTAANPICQNVLEQDKELQTVSHGWTEGMSKYLPLSTACWFYDVCFHYKNKQ